MFKSIHRYFQHRYERFYIQSHWHLVLDLSMLIVIIFLSAGLFALYVYHPQVTLNGNKIRPAVDLNNPPLALDFFVATSTITLEQGGLLQISYKNEGTAAITNLTLDLTTVDAPNFSVEKLTLPSNPAGVTVQGREVAIAKIAAGESGEVLVQAYFKAKNAAARTIDWQAQEAYTFGGQALTLTETLPVLNLAATWSVKDVAYYTSPEGDQLGVGPIPPVVGIPTTYWIFWSVSSPSDFKNIVLNARLPKGVELGEGRSLLAGDFSYSTSTRQIIWRIKDLTGSNDSYRLGLEVRVVPTAAQVGQTLPLLEALQYSGSDNLTGEVLTGTAPALSSNLDNDRFNAGQGRVVNQ
jgi:hypothetical protein